MSGHSKWATIKRQKGTADAKRGAVFTKLSKAITIAVKQGGGIGDPSQNFRLRLAVEAARSANMPKENIERAISRASGKAGEGSMDEVVYEGFGPGGVSLIVEAITDNKNRTTSEVKSIFDKNGGTMGQPGTVAYQFKQIGFIVTSRADKSFDEILLDAADAGAEDVEEGEGSEVFVYTKPGDLAKVRGALADKGYAAAEMEITRKPLNPVLASEKETEGPRVASLIEKLEALDDVQKVYSNMLFEE